MTKIEKIALDEAKSYLYKAQEGLREFEVPKEQLSIESAQHKAVFALSDINKALATIRAIEENNPELYKP